MNFHWQRRHEPHLVFHTIPSKMQPPGQPHRGTEIHAHQSRQCHVFFYLFLLEGEASNERIVFGRRHGELLTYVRSGGASQMGIAFRMYRKFILSLSIEASLPKAVLWNHTREKVYKMKRGPLQLIRITGAPRANRGSIRYSGFVLTCRRNVTEVDSRRG